MFGKNYTIKIHACLAHACSIDHQHMYVLCEFNLYRFDGIISVKIIVSNQMFSKHNS